LAVDFGNLSGSWDAGGAKEPLCYFTQRL